jgi:hypothetical protein
VLGGFLLFAQFLGAVHVHRLSSLGVAAPSAATTGESGECAICLATSHAPLAAPVAGFIARTFEVVATTVEPRLECPSSPELAAPHGRAPPATV